MRFLGMFFALLAGKVWGWIGEGRVEIMEQGQGMGRPRGLAYTRLALSLALGVAFSFGMLDYVVGQVMRMARPDMMVMFGFEFAILSVSNLSTAARMAVNMFEVGIIRNQKKKRIEGMRRERLEAARIATEAESHNASIAVEAEPHEPGTAQVTTEQQVVSATEARRLAEEPIDESEVEVEGWEGKGRWVFYLDLATDFFKLIIYLSFFFILLIFYGLPIHIMRDVFLTCRSFFKRIADFVRYRTATKDMNERYPDATEDEIRQGDVCIICREEMRVYRPAAAGSTDPLAERMRPKKLPCGHILHFTCLRSWLERQQTCPTCRRPVVVGGSVRATGAPVQAAVHGQQPHAGADRPGPRVFQFGPLRIGVGAARGNNMFEELQQQMAQEQQQRPVLPAANLNGPQQYGFGIRWDGMRRRGQRRDRHVSSAQDQLDTVGRQIQHEIDGLRLTARELQMVRSMQAELARLQGLRSHGNQGVQATTQLPALSNSVTTLIGNSQAGVVEAGSDRLPNGLTLPPGWTMMPLQQQEAHAQVPGLSAPLYQAGPIANNVFNMGFPGVPPFMAPLPNLFHQTATAPLQHNHNMLNSENHPLQSPAQTHGAASSNTTSMSAITPEQLRAAEEAVSRDFVTATHVHNQTLAAGRAAQEPQRTEQSDPVQEMAFAGPDHTESSQFVPRADEEQGQLDDTVTNSNVPSLPHWGSSAVPRETETEQDSESSDAANSCGTVATPSLATTVEDLVERPD